MSSLDHLIYLEELFKQKNLFIKQINTKFGLSAKFQKRLEITIFFLYSHRVHEELRIDQTKVYRLS